MTHKYVKSSKSFANGNTIENKLDANFCNMVIMLYILYVLRWVNDDINVYLMDK